MKSLKNQKKTGICGAWVIAQLAKKSVKEIIANWGGGIFGWNKYKGYCPMKDLIRELEKYGIEVVRKRTSYKKGFEVVADIAIAFIQWEGSYKHWMEAYKNTHWVIVEFRDDHRVWIGCSENGWFPKDSKRGKNYLKDGYIRSYLALTKRGR